MKENLIQKKSYAFAIHIVEFCKILRKQKEFDIARQLLKSGTSIAANVEEGIHGQSKRDFIAKFSISHKESHETLFWLRLIRDTHITDNSLVLPLIIEANDIISLLTRILLSARKETQ